MTSTSSTKAKPKTKKELAAEARLAEKQKVAAKKKAKKDGTYKSDDEDDGGYSAPSKGAPIPKLPIGSMTKCSTCEKKFTVVSIISILAIVARTHAFLNPRNTEVILGEE